LLLFFNCLKKFKWQKQLKIRGKYLIFVNSTLILKSFSGIFCVLCTVDAYKKLIRS